MTSPNESPESVLTKSEKSILAQLRENAGLELPRQAISLIDRLLALSASDAAKIGELEAALAQAERDGVEATRQRDALNYKWGSTREQLDGVMRENSRLDAEVDSLKSSLSSSVEQAKRMGEVVYEADRLSKGVGTYRELDAALAALSPPAEALSQSRPVDGQGGSVEELPAAQQEEEYEGWRVKGGDSCVWIFGTPTGDWFVHFPMKRIEKSSIPFSDLNYPELTGPARIARIKEAIAAGLKVEPVKRRLGDVLVKNLTDLRDDLRANNAGGISGPSLKVVSTENTVSVPPAPSAPSASVDDKPLNMRSVVRKFSGCCQLHGLTDCMTCEPPQRSAVDEARHKFNEAICCGRSTFKMLGNSIDPMIVINAVTLAEERYINTLIDAKLAEVAKPAEKVDGREVYKDRLKYHWILFNDGSCVCEFSNGTYSIRDSIGTTAIKQNIGTYAPYTPVSGSERDEVLARFDAKMGEQK